MYPHGLWDRDAVIFFVTTFPSPGEKVKLTTDHYYTSGLSVWEPVLTTLLKEMSQ